MSTRRIDLLIDESRRETNNVTFSSDSGINDEEALKFANDGQDRIFSLILSKTPDLFQEEEEQTVVANQEAYPINDLAVLGSRVEKVEYSPNSLPQNYYMVRQGKLAERVGGLSGRPEFYIRRSNTILLQPKPQSSGLLRITFQKRIPRLDKRRAQVSSVTLGVDTITSLVIDTTTFNSEDETILENEAFITIVDKDGAVKMRGIPITDVDSNTGVISVDTFTFDSGETIAVGDWVVKGKYSTTHSELPEECEHYLTQYMNWRFFKEDSSQDAEEAAVELQMKEEQILLAFSEPDTDIDYPALIDGQFMTHYE